jgi:hypothetical protein
MKNFTNQEIAFLVENGFLMPEMDKYDIEWYLYPNKPIRIKNDSRDSFALTKLPLGYPVLVRAEKIIKKIPNFKLEWLKSYPLSLNGKPIDLYMVPKGLEKLINFSNSEELINKLNDWLDLSEKYVAENSDNNEMSQTEIDLLTTFRQLYFIYITLENKDISPISEVFLKNYEQGRRYRDCLSTEFKKIHKSLISDNKFYELLANIFESEQDIILLEEEILKNHFDKYWGTRGLCGIELPFAHLWYNILNQKYKGSSYKEISPFLLKFRKTLYDYKEKSRAAKDVKTIFNWMAIYDFSILKEDYLHFFNNSPKKEIIQFIEKKLKENNALPKVSSQLLIKEDVKTVYTNTLTFNFDLIKEKIANHILGAETLLAIVTKAFRESEKECTFISYEIFAKDGIFNFLIESLDINSTKELSEKLITYLNSVISSGFLTLDMIKELIKHGNSLERRRYENDQKIMKEYIRINSTALLNKELDKELKTNVEKKKINKL